MRRSGQVKSVGQRVARDTAQQGVRARRMGTRKCHIAMAAFAVAGLLFAGRANADEGPLLVAERPRLDPLNLSPFQAWLDLNYFRDDETQATRGTANTSKTHFTEDQFQEIFTLKTTGYIVHPNLVDLKLQGSIGLEQDLLDEEGKRGTENGVFYGWDLSATLFRKEEMPVTLYSRRTTTDYSQPFGPSLQNTIETDGVIFDWQNKTVPTRVEYYHLTEEEKTLNGSQNYQETEDVVTWHSRYEPTLRNRSSLDYTFTSGSSNSSAEGSNAQTNNDFTTNNVSLGNELDFGQDAKNYLQSSLMYLNETGTFQLSDLRWNENLYFQNTERFSSNFRYYLDKESVGSGFGGAGTDQLLQRGDAQFIHHLFKSLVTTADIGFQSASLQPSGGETEYFGTLNFDYAKIVPFGKLAASFGVGYDQTQNSASGQVTHIINQQFTFNGTLPLTINGNDIIASSVIITDATGARIYQPGLDYVVRSFAQFIEIERILGGNIPAGQSVLISYDLAAQPANTLRTNTISVGGRYDFNTGLLRGVGLYAHYIDQDQAISTSAAETLVPASLVDKTVGVDYRVWELTFLAEQDWHHSSIAPYNQFRTDARWVHPLSPSASFTLESSYLMSHYLQTNDHLTDFIVTASGAYQISPELSINGSVQWQDQQDQLFGATRGLEEELEAQWKHRETTAYFQARNSNLRYDIVSNQIQTIRIGIRRTF